MRIRLFIKYAQIVRKKYKKRTLNAYNVVTKLLITNLIVKLNLQISLELYHVFCLIKLVQKYLVNINLNIGKTAA